MNQTPNYQLNQWEATDQVKREDFNADNAKIDAALAALAFQDCKIVHGTYRGDGEKCKTLSLTFDAPPLLVLISGNLSLFIAVYKASTGFYLTHQNGVTHMNLTWTGNTLSWSTSVNASEFLMNADAEYHYVALMSNQ